MRNLDELLSGRVMAILRGLGPKETVRLASRAWDLGISAVEVPIGDAAQLPSLVAAIHAGRERGLGVGAGTVVTVLQVRAAAQTGAAYTVAPGLDPIVMATSEAAGLPHLPGVATPSEVQRLSVQGVRWMKGFPASSLGPSWFREMRGPFAAVRFVATGGITAVTAADFLAAGAQMVAVGSALTSEHEIDLLAQLVNSEPRA